MKLISLFLGLLALVGAPGVLASTIHVPKDQPTIQAGINAANTGDVVLVSPGTYKENINFDGKAITVTSAKGPRVTVIDGGAVAPVVAFVTNEDTRSVLNRFTVQNGAGTGNFGYQGGGISITGASPTLTNNVIKNNTAGDGGGIGLSGGSPVIAGNIIDGNYAQFGGGIAIVGSSNAQIVHNTISNNSGGSGGAFELFAAANVFIEDNEIIGNTASQGGGFWIVNEADEIIVQNLIANNSAFSGSQVYSLIPQSSLGFRLINNTIISVAPSIIGGSADVAVIADGFNTNVLIVNNIIFAPFDGAALLCNPIYNGGPPIVQNNDAFNMLGVSYGDSCAGMDGTQGNISGNPEFVHLGKITYELQPGSPAINTGTNSAPDLPKKDLAGHPRIIGGTIDMGAYEYQGKESDRK